MTATQQIHVAGRASNPRRAPAEPAFWVLIAGDVLIFTAFFLYYCVYAGRDPAEVEASQQHLNQTLGLASTLVLLTSSWSVARGVHAMRLGGYVAARHNFVVTAGLGLVFVVLKLVAWHGDVAAGLTLNSNPFFTLYFMFTGIHLTHVIAGIVVLEAMRVLLATDLVTPADEALVEGGAVYWHMVDLLWIALFALLFLVR